MMPTEILEKTIEQTEIGHANYPNLGGIELIDLVQWSRMVGLSPENSQAPRWMQNVLAITPINIAQGGSFEYRGRVTPEDFMWLSIELSRGAMRYIDEVDIEPKIDRVKEEERVVLRSQRRLKQADCIDLVGAVGLTVFGERYTPFKNALNTYANLLRLRADLLANQNYQADFVFSRTLGHWVTIGPYSGNVFPGGARPKDEAQRDREGAIRNRFRRRRDIMAGFTKGKVSPYAQMAKFDQYMLMLIADMQGLGGDWYDGAFETTFPDDDLIGPEIFGRIREALFPDNGVVSRAKKLIGWRL